MNYPIHKVLLLVLFLGGSVLTHGQKNSKTVKSEVGSKTVSKEETEFYFTEGVKFYLLEDFGKAKQFFGKALEGDPKAHAAAYKLAEILSASEESADIEQAAVLINNALSLEKTNRYYYELAARIYSSSGKHAEAAKILEQMVGTLSQAGESVWSDMATYYELDGNLQEAYKTLERFEKKFGTREEISMKKIELLNGLGRNQEALSESKRLMDNFPDEPRYILGYASMCFTSGKNEEGVRLLQSLINSGEDGGYGSLMLTEFYLQSGERLKALELAEKTVDRPEVDAENLIVLFKALIREAEEGKSSAGQNASESEALKSILKKIQERFPGNANVLLTGGDYFTTSGESLEALKYYRNAIRFGARDFQVWNNILLLDLRENLFDSLIVHAEEALEFFPNQGIVWYFNGLGQFQKKKFKQAINCLEQAKKLLTEKELAIELNNLLAESYQAEKQYEKADECFEVVLKLDPNEYSVINNYTYYLALRRSKLDRAEALALRLYQSQPSNPSFTDTYAWVLFAREKYKEAESVLNDVVNSGKANATHLEHYGDILYMLGRTEEAVKHWEKSLSMNSQNDSLRKKILNRRLN